MRLQFLLKRFSRLFCAHGVTHLRVAGNQIGDDVNILPGSGDFNLRHFQSGMIDEECLSELGHRPPGKTQHDKTG